MFSVILSPISKKKDDKKSETWLTNERCSRRLFTDSVTYSSYIILQVFNEKTTARTHRNNERMSALEEAEQQHKLKMEAKRAEIHRLRHEIADLRSGNLSSSQTSLSMYNENNQSQNSTMNSTAKSSPPHNGSSSTSGTMKKRIGGLGIFNRNWVSPFLYFYFFRLCKCIISIV